MNVIILGATGQLGNYLYHYLKKNTSWEITGTSRKPIRGFCRFDPFNDSWTVLGQADVLINCIGQIQELQGMSF